MARPDIKNLTDLNDYLTVLEERIAFMEQEDRTIKEAINDVNHNMQTNKEQTNLPATGLLSCNFFTRAFSVWWHYFVASFIIGLVFAFIYMTIFVFILGNIVKF